MDVKIYPIPLGIDTCYIIQDKGTVMVDSGVPKKAKDFIKALEKISIKPDEIQLIVLTHGHWDHVGSARKIKEITGAKVAIHQHEKGWAENSTMEIPPGVNFLGRIFSVVIKIIFPLIHVPSTQVDLELSEEDFSLESYGIPGRVVFTPGHTSGSVSVLLDTGDVFVGDLAMNKFPLRINHGLPILAEDLDRVKKSWKMLLDRGIKTIYPAHGKPFPADRIQKAL
jgi:glyoxylase-like metal-dependent hydrolase (beta-lactamase superfamily II)